MIAKVNSKPVARGGGADVHVRKDSHLATPVDAKTEWHLRSDDVNMKCTPGKMYTMCIPVICTSADDESQRLRQTSKPYLEKGSVFDTKMKPDGGK